MISIPARSSRFMRVVGRAIVCSTLCFSMSACKEEPGADVEYEAGEIIDTSKNFKFPKELKEYIDDEYVAFMKTQGPPFDIKTKEELLLQVPREYLDVQVFLTPLAAGTLSHPTRISAVRGGGVVDLKDVVHGAKGSFFFDQKIVKTSDPKSAPQKLKIFYLSNAKKRKVGEESFGAGCGRYMDVTDYVTHVQGKGVQVNATDQRYLSVLAGTYYYFGFEKERLFLAAVQIQDSRYPSLQCEI